MKFLHRARIGCLALGLITLFGLAPRALAAPDMPSPSSGQAEPGARADWGKFVSFTDGMLTLNTAEGLAVWSNLTDKTPVFIWEKAVRDYRPAAPAVALAKVEAGAWVFVAANKASIRVGPTKENRTTGTFVSFKDGRMLLLGKDLPVGEYTKKYGNHLNYPKFSENVPVFESIDGGDYTFAGAPSATLPALKEGSLVTVYSGPDDGNFIRIEIGVATRK